VPLDATGGVARLASGRAATVATPAAIPVGFGRLAERSPDDGQTGQNSGTFPIHDVSSLLFVRGLLVSQIIAAAPGSGFFGNFLVFRRHPNFSLCHIICKRVSHLQIISRINGEILAS
jgi:hypothetical protein